MRESNMRESEEMMDRDVRGLRWAVGTMHLQKHSVGFVGDLVHLLSCPEDTRSDDGKGSNGEKSHQKADAARNTFEKRIR